MVENSYKLELTEKSKNILLNNLILFENIESNSDQNEFSIDTFNELLVSPNKHHIYESIINKVRLENKTFSIPFHFDSTGKRYFMTLNISSDFNQDIILDTELLGEKNLDRITENNSENSAIIIMCSWCKDIEYNGKWLKFETAISQLELFNQSSVPSVSHGICNCCAINVRAEITNLN